MVIIQPSYKGMEQQAVNCDPMSIAISPLAMPLFAGPGTITTALSLANEVSESTDNRSCFCSMCHLSPVKKCKQAAGFLGEI